MAVGLLAYGQTGAQPVYFLSVKRWSVDDEGPACDASNTEGYAAQPGPGPTPSLLAVLAAAGRGPTPAKGFGATLGGYPSKAKIVLEQATYDEAECPFVPPFSLVPGSFVRVEIYPWFAGFGQAPAVGARGPHVFESVLVTRCGPSGEVGGLQPVTIEGTSNGRYTLASPP